MSDSRRGFLQALAVAGAGLAGLLGPSRALAWHRRRRWAGCAAAPPCPAALPPGAAFIPRSAYGPIAICYPPDSPSSPIPVADSSNTPGQRLFCAWGKLTRAGAVNSAVLTWSGGQSTGTQVAVPGGDGSVWAFLFWGSIPANTSLTLTVSGVVQGPPPQPVQQTAMFQVADC